MQMFSMSSLNKQGGDIGMLSKEMYTVLSCFPKKLGKAITYEALLSSCKISHGDLIECLNETLYPSWNYVRSSDGWKIGSLLFLTESGLSRVEEYEDSAKDHKIIKRTLMVSILAMLISLISAVTAIISLIR